MAAPTKRDDGADQAAELKAWRMTFRGGFDYLRALPKIGVPIDAKHQPDRAAAENAWRRLGRAFLDWAAEQPPHPLPSWAERQFGNPDQVVVSQPRGRRR